jgi:hypothetical protein
MTTLNTEQQRAVDTTEGPVLIIAEPPKKWSKIEIFLAEMLHRIGSLIK